MVFREQVLVFSQPGALPAEALDNLIEQVRALDMEAVHAEVAKQQEGRIRDRPVASVAMLRRVARSCYVHRWRVLIAWVVVLIGVDVLAQTAGGTLLKTFSFRERVAAGVRRAGA